MTHSVNDIVKISALSIMLEHNTPELDCTVRDVRKYQDAKNAFAYVAYICTPSADPDANPYMVLIKTVGNVSDISLYHLDKGVPAGEAAPFVLAPGGEDLLPQFCSYVNDTEGNEQELVWAKTAAGTEFGVKYQDCNVRYKESGVSDIKTIAEFTTATAYFRPRCFVEWSGDAVSGWLEFWYGEIITDIEVSFSKAAQPL